MKPNTLLPLLTLSLSLMSCVQTETETWYGNWFYMSEDQSVNISTYQTSLDVLDQQVLLSVDCDEESLAWVAIHTDILSDFGDAPGQVTIEFDDDEPDVQEWQYWRYFTDDAHYKTSIYSQRMHAFVARLLEAERLTLHFRGTDETTVSVTWPNLRGFPAAYESLQKECPRAFNPPTPWIDPRRHGSN